ncbi:hypothetical protein [Nocardioides lianchengensis]|uniref:Phage major capsid protein E n=1 Tax=Nocardioides lianchengensis TaxID=1045774 RepID=A0A1G6LRW9_9ACTN|nr:hypothetical protein [Nocardioides lianchengensis]NYG12464.1 hypothetical protein [Nocardioides lianchengensis]SDC45949.1 hypothetical protein SAMN05421872_102340 [Nocardioides lianchengensis]
MTQLTLDGGRKITVDDIRRNPLWLPARILELLDGQFIDDILLRYEGDASTIAFEEGSSLFLDDEIQELLEFEEIPVAGYQRGLPRVALATRKGLGVRVSEDMRRENNIGAINRQVLALTNTMIRARFLAMRQLVMNPAIPTIPASAAWNTSSGRPRKDFAAAMEVVASAGNDTVDTTENYEADTTVMPGSITPILLDNEDFLKVYGGDMASKNIAYTGKLEQDVLGMLGLKARFWPNDRVLVCQRKTIGFYTDPRPLEVTPLYPEGNGPNGGPTESHRVDATMKRGMGIDQPLAACWITGVVED